MKPQPQQPSKTTSGDSSLTGPMSIQGITRRSHISSMKSFANADAVPIDYRQYLSEIEGLSGRLTEHENQDRYASNINTGALRALFDNLDALPEDSRTAAALAIDTAIRTTRRDDWRGNRFRRREVRNAIARLINEEFSDYDLDIDAIFELVMNQNDY